MSDTRDDSCTGPKAPGGLDCRAVIEQLWEYLDAELGPERMQAVRTHLTLCAECYPQYDFERAFLEAISSCGCSTCAPYDVRCHVVEALKRVGFTGTMKVE
jgi:anti-sigma factor (TIGR02949 family)